MIKWIAHGAFKGYVSARYNKEVLTGPYIMEKIYEVTKGEANHYDGCRPASDVGCTIL